MAIAGSGFSIGGFGAASFQGGPRLNNLEAAKVAMMRGSQGPRETGENNLQKAQWALQKRPGGVAYGKSLNSKMFKNLDYKLDFPAELYKQEYEGKWNVEPWDGATEGPMREDYRKKMMKAIINQSYDQLAMSSRSIYKTTEGTVTPKTIYDDSK